MEKDTYQDYVKNNKFLSYYNDYQRRYGASVAERDKILLSLIAANANLTGRLLDIGCSTGNLLNHISRSFPTLRLTGGDLAELSLAEARHLYPNIEFETMNMLKIEGAYDCIVANAVAVYFDWETYESALQSVSNALDKGGVYIAFEWLHIFNQDLEITERCLSHPNGLTYHFRSEDRVRSLLTKAGFTTIDFIPFFMPFDLDRPDVKGDTVSYTERLEDGRRLSFRGSLNQPWCHLIARKDH